jgi:hypothetical protein
VKQWHLAAGNPIAPPRLSLVLFESPDGLEHNVSFINWRDSTTWLGQCVKLDVHDRFVWATDIGGCPFFNLRAPTIVWPDIGQRLYRAKGPLRADAPEHPLALLRIFGRALSPMPDVDAAKCILCNEDHTSHCPLCGVVLHDECGLRMSKCKRVARSGVALLDAAKDSTVPDALKSFRSLFPFIVGGACEMCSLWVHQMTA